MINSIGIVGYGHFGSFLPTLFTRFVPEAVVKVHSDHREIDQVTFFALPEVAACDVVILCGSIRDYETELLTVLPHTTPETILVDVATVKKHPTEIFQKHAADRHWISTHPMFGPESYRKKDGDVTGLRIVITDYTLPNDAYVACKKFLTTLGFLVIEMSADEHDKLLAESLFLTHYVGQVISRAGFTRTSIDTVSFSYLMDAVESVQHDSKLFADVYRFNPYCQEVVKQFATQQTVVMNTLLQTPT